MTSRGNVKYELVPTQPTAGQPTPSKRLFASRRRKYRRKMERRKNDSVCIWFLRSPLTRWTFLFFVLCIILSFILFLLYQYWTKKLIYIVSGLFGIIVGMYGLHHFRQLLSLREEVDLQSKLNLELRKDCLQFEQEVRGLETVNVEIEQKQQNISSSVVENKELSEGFAALTNHMNAFNIQSVNEILPICKKVTLGKNKWIEELVSEERYVMHSLFDRFEKRGNSRKGMSIQGFDAFVQSIPSIYRTRFIDVGTFNDITNGKNIITYRDFGFALDIFCASQERDYKYGKSVDWNKTGDKSISNSESNNNINVNEIGVVDEDMMVRTIQEMQETQARREELLQWHD